jgi:hypothetical protein
MYVHLYMYICMYMYVHRYGGVVLIPSGYRNRLKNIHGFESSPFCYELGCFRHTIQRWYLYDFIFFGIAFKEANCTKPLSRVAHKTF